MMVMPSLTLFEVAALGFQPPKAMLHQLRATPWVGELGENIKPFKTLKSVTASPSHQSFVAA